MYIASIVLRTEKTAQIDSLRTYLHYLMSEASYFL